MVDTDTVSVHIVFKTERADVRCWEESDADRLFDFFSRDEVVRWPGRRQPMTERQQAVDQIRRWNERFADSEYGVWALHERTAPAPAGSITSEWQLVRPATKGTVRATIGDGGAAVIARTFKGRITLVRQPEPDINLTVPGGVSGTSP